MEGNGVNKVRPNRVRELRENRLMTQAQLARKAKVALRTIHSVEKGMNAAAWIRSGRSCSRSASASKTRIRCSRRCASALPTSSFAASERARRAAAGALDRPRRACLATPVLR